MPEQTFRERHHRKIWIAKVAIVVAAVVLGFYGFFWRTLGWELAERLRATGIIASTALTLALIIIYRDIGVIQRDQVGEMVEQRQLQEQVTDIQSKQATIMERQEELMALQYRPKLRVRGISYEDVVSA